MTGRALFRMTGEILRGIATCIWSIVVLSDSTIVTGDSRGHVQFWDGEIGVLTATIQQHTAEVLVLAVSPDENQVFASGTDSRVTCMKRIITSTSDENNIDGVISKGNNNSQHSQWVHTTAQRPHSHDVFALTVVPNINGSNNKLEGSKLISGGMDCKLCVYDIQGFGQLRPTSILPIRARGLVGTDLDENGSGWSVVRHRNHLDIWKLNSNYHNIIKDVTDNNKDITDTQKSNHDKEINRDSPCKLLMRLQSKDLHHFICSAMAIWNTSTTTSSRNNFIVVASNGKGTKIWYLSYSNEDDVISVKKIVIPKVADVPCAALCFSNDSHVLALLSNKNEIILLDLIEIIIDDSIEIKISTRLVLTHTIQSQSSLSSQIVLDDDNINIYKKEIDNVLVHLAISSDGLWIAVADASINGRVYIYDLDR